MECKVQRSVALCVGSCTRFFSRGALTLRVSYTMVTQTVFWVATSVMQHGSTIFAANFGGQINYRINAVGRAHHKRKGCVTTSLNQREIVCTLEGCPLLKLVH